MCYLPSVFRHRLSLTFKAKLEMELEELKALDPINLLGSHTLAPGPRKKAFLNGGLFSRLSVLNLICGSFASAADIDDRVCCANHQQQPGLTRPHILFDASVRYFFFSETSTLKRLAKETVVKKLSYARVPI
jgi:hypothetical protein